MHWAGGWGMGGFGWLFMVVFWALVILGIVFLVKAVMSSTKNEGKTETALDVLKKRYARRFSLSLESSRTTFTPLEKATDEIGGGYFIKADGGIMLPSAHTVRGRSSLTGFT